MGKPDDDAKDARAKRLAEALRANLKRRKQQSRDAQKSDETNAASE